VLASVILQRGIIPVIGQGKARWNNVHVADLSDLFRLLVDKAVQTDTNDELWGAKGYMLAENGEHVWSELARTMANKAAELGYISSTEPPKEYSMEKDEALEIAGFEAITWGLNSRGKAERARRYLGWQPHRPSLEESAEEILEDESKRLSKS
jgi:nucleoside-diphosphate-sugar epimerase